MSPKPIVLALSYPVVQIWFLPRLLPIVCNSAWTVLSVYLSVAIISCLPRNIIFRPRKHRKYRPDFIPIQIFLFFIVYIIRQRINFSRLVPGTAGSEITMQLSQMIYLAGQRNKQVKIAEANTRLVRIPVFRPDPYVKIYTAHRFLYHSFSSCNPLSVYDEEIKSLQQVVNAFEEQEGKGYIAEKEVIRIKAQLYSLLSEYPGPGKSDQ